MSIFGKHFLRRARKIRIALRFLTYVGLFGYLMMPVVYILTGLRIGHIKVTRMGHFVQDVALRFAEGPGLRDLYWVDKRVRPANDFWFEMFRRNFRVRDGKLLGSVVKVAQMIPYSPKWWLPPPWTQKGSRDTGGLFASTTRSMQFTEEENRSGQDWLTSVGCLPGQPFVCLMVRDATYLNEDIEHRPDGKFRPDHFWDYHSYRDSDIASFLPAAEWLTAQGMVVFRMGKKMGTALHSENPMIIDYAFNPERSSFLDIWLFANCDFTVTTGTGPDLISQIYGIPTVAVNYIPLTSAWTSTPVITSGKALYDAGGTRLSLEDHLLANFSTTKAWEEANITIRDLSEGEILDVVREAWERFNGRWEDDGNDHHNQDHFRKILKGSSAKDAHGFFHPEARLSTRWISQLEQERAGFKT